ncbi:MAG TPA: hypothetical protein VFG76_07975 [Candidatus Polarisedimenticolia bacterium]|nr:hypothetical protein [Candidatus Polarisedimenticolia bacterium]
MIRRCLELVGGREWADYLERNGRIAQVERVIPLLVFILTIYALLIVAAV